MTSSPFLTAPGVRTRAAHALHALTPVIAAAMAVVLAGAAVLTGELGRVSLVERGRAAMLG